MRCSRPSARAQIRAFYCCVAISALVLLMIAAPRAAHAEGFFVEKQFDTNNDDFGQLIGPVGVDTGTNGADYAWFGNYFGTEWALTGFGLGDDGVDRDVEFQGGATAGALNGIGGIVSDNKSTTSPWVFVSSPSQNRVLAYERVFPPGPLGVDQTTVKQIPGPVTNGGVASSGDPGEFNFPLGVDVGPDGSEWNLYVLDRFNNRVQAFDTNDTLDFRAEAGNSGWSDYPATGPLAVDQADGTVYVAASMPSGGAVFSAPAGLTTDFGETFFTDDNISAMTIDQNARLLYVATGSSPSTIVVFDLRTGRDLGSFQLPEGDSDTAVGLATINSLGFESSARSLYVVMQDGSFFLAKAYGMQQLYCDDPAPITLQPGQSVTVTLSGCLRSTSPRPYRVTQAPTQGTADVQDSPDQITYTAPANASGSDSFKFLAVDRYGGMAEKTQVINFPSSQPSPSPAGNPPTYKDDANLSRSTGTILVKLPGTNQYVNVSSTAAVPLGTIVDARDGVAFITWARPDGTTYSGQFWGGVFEIKQDTGKDPYAVVKLRDDLVKQARTSRLALALASGSATDQFSTYIAASRGKKKNKVWGKAKGKFRTDGSSSSASVRGTEWLVQNYANGTYTYVKSGVVEVKPYSKKKKQKTKKIKKGQSYFVWK